MSIALVNYLKTKLTLETEHRDRGEHGNIETSFNSKSWLETISIQVLADT